MTENSDRHVVAVVLVLASVTSLIVALLLVGERGNDVITGISVLVAVALGLIRFAVAPEQIRDTFSGATLPRRILVAVGALVLCASVAGGVYLVARIPVVEVVAGSLRVDGADDLRPDSFAAIVFAGPTPDRTNLGLGLQLVDFVGSGDCLTGATLTLTPRVGGVERPPVLITSDDAFRTPAAAEVVLDGSVPDLRVEVGLRSAVGCRLRLVVTEAVFYG